MKIESVIKVPEALMRSSAKNTVESVAEETLFTRAGRD
jgi:hypothetical protein